jgi:drug/metabolite transporter (DMT)-like permease
MNPHALLLVGGSAVLHATWNYLAKRASDQVAFMFLMMAVSPVVMLGPLLWMIAAGYHFGPWYLPLLGGIFQALYCFLMGRGYECGDLSHVYPLARGLAPVLIAVLAWPLLHEGLSVMGTVGIGLVVVGTLALNTDDCRDLLNGRTIRGFLRPASRWALLASITIACYHMIDKAGAMRATSPLAYLLVMHLWLTLFLGLLTLTVRRPAQVLAEWRRNWKAALVVMALCFTAYLAVVTAMTLTQVAYVASLRNVSILLGVVLGVAALREEGALWRVLGALLMVAGIVAIAVAG